MPDLTSTKPRSDVRAIVIAGVIVVPVLIVAAAVFLIGDAGYDALSRSYPGLATSMASGLLRVVADFAGALTLGALAVAAFVIPRAGRGRLLVHNGVDLAVVRWSSGIWALCSIALVAVDAADASGQSASRLLEPGSLSYLVEASYLPGAWMVTAALAFVVFCAANWAESWMAAILMAALSAVALLAPVLVTQVMVGPNHDFGGDAAMFGTPAVALWLGATCVFALGWRSGRTRSPEAVRRFTVLSSICAVAAATALMVIAVFELAGTSPLSSPTGILFLIQFALLGALGIVALRHRRKTASSVAAGSSTPRVLVVAAAILAAALGISVTMLRIPPPQYFVPTSITQLFLGFDVDAAPTLDVLATHWRVNILFAVLAAAAVGFYLWALIRLRRRGDSWPVGRTVTWILGWAVVFVTTSSGLGKYSTVSFSTHMVLHMCLNMLGPLLLVMGGAVTLALRAIPARGRGEPAGPHEWLTGLLNWSVTRSLYNPLWVFASFVGSFYLIYLTPIFEEAMRYHWSHQLMNLHFLVGGYLFYSLVIGVDHPPRPLPHIGKLGLVLAAMPFHAFFGVVIMSSTTVIAGQFYEYIGLPWMNDLVGDQYLGGGIAWAAGELPLIVVVIALGIQWARQDSRVAARTDRHLDAGLDDSFDAYNDMLTRLGTRQKQFDGTTTNESPKP